MDTLAKDGYFVDIYDPVTNKSGRYVIWNISKYIIKIYHIDDYKR